MEKEGQAGDGWLTQGSRGKVAVEAVNVCLWRLNMLSRCCMCTKLAEELLKFERFFQC